MSCIYEPSLCRAVREEDESVYVGVLQLFLEQNYQRVSV